MRKQVRDARKKPDPVVGDPVVSPEAICAHLDEKLAEVKRIVAGIESQIATLTAYRKSLIHECVTGQRLVTDADVARARGGKTGADPLC